MRSASWKTHRITRKAEVPYFLQFGFIRGGAHLHARAVSGWGCCKCWPRPCSQGECGPRVSPNPARPDAAPCRPGNSDRPQLKPAPQLLRSKLVFPSLLPPLPSRQDDRGTVIFQALLPSRAIFSIPPRIAASTAAEGEDLQPAGDCKLPSPPPAAIVTARFGPPHESSRDQPLPTLHAGNLDFAPPLEPN